MSAPLSPSPLRTLASASVETELGDLVTRKNGWTYLGLPASCLELYVLRPRSQTAALLYYFAIEYVAAVLSGRRIVLQIVSDASIRAAYHPGSKRVSRRTQAMFKSLGASDGPKTHAEVWFILSLACDVLLTGRTLTKREIYYSATHLFRSADCAYAAVAKACSVVGVPRHSLGVVAAPRGWVAGNVVFRPRNSTAWVAPSTSPEQIDTSIPAVGIDVQPSTAKFILVVEKYAAFQWLVEDRLLDTIPCIIITGCGYPCVSSRALVHELVKFLRVPCYGICDWNPHGVDLLLSYKLGVLSLAHGSNEFYVDLKWLGPLDVDVANLETSHKLVHSEMAALSRLDQRKAAILTTKHPFLTHRDGAAYTAQLKSMVSVGRKLELETMNGMGMQFLSKWIVNTVRGRGGL